MPALPKSYNKILQRAYPDCRMRWSDMRECWLLERKANYARLDIDPAKYPERAVDTFIQHRDGYYLAGQYAPDRLPDADRLVSFLRSQDTRYMDLGPGDAVAQAVRYAERLEAQEAEAKAKAWHEQSFEGSGAGAELYDHLAWEEGRRVAVPTVYDHNVASGKPNGPAIEP